MGANFFSFFITTFLLFDNIRVGLAPDNAISIKSAQIDMFSPTLNKIAIFNTRVLKLKIGCCDFQKAHI